MLIVCFQVGTLDQLVGLSDDLGKLDGFVEGVTRKVAQYLGEVIYRRLDYLVYCYVIDDIWILLFSFILCFRYWKSKEINSMKI